MSAALTVPTVWATILALVWLGILLRTPVARLSQRQRASVIIFLFAVHAVTFTVPSIQYRLDAAIGIADLSSLLGHLSALLTLSIGLEIIATMTGRRHRLLRTTEIGFGVAMGCLIMVFVIMPRRLDQPDIRRWHASDLTVITYQMIVLVCLAVGLSIILAFLVPHWRTASRGPLRTALLLMWLGIAMGLAYVAARVWFVLAYGLGLLAQTDHTTSGLVTRILLYSAVLTAEAGILVRAIHGWRRYLRHYLAYHRLHGLWAELTGAVPETVLEPPPRNPIRLLPSNAIQLRLYRRTVEIRDAQLELTRYVPPDMHAAAATTLAGHDPEVEPALDACVLRLALRLKRRGSPRLDNPPPVSWSTDASLDGEVKQLAALARMMRNPEVIAAATAASDSERHQ